MAQRQVLSVQVGQPLGLLVVFGELQGGLTALGQQRPVGQERLLLPRRHVDAVGETVLHGEQDRAFTASTFKRPTESFRPNKPSLLRDLTPLKSALKTLFMEKLCPTVTLFLN